MSKFDQAKLLLKARKIQKELEHQIITITKGDGAVTVEISGDQKLKKIKINPDDLNLDDIEQLELWLTEAIREALTTSQRIATEKMQPMMGALGSLGL